MSQQPPTDDEQPTDDAPGFSRPAEFFRQRKVGLAWWAETYSMGPPRFENPDPDETGHKPKVGDVLREVNLAGQVVGYVEVTQAMLLDPTNNVENQFYVDPHIVKPSNPRFEELGGNEKFERLQREFGRQQQSHGGPRRPR